MSVPPLSHHFNGGTQGATVATSDTGNGNAWDGVAIGTGGAITYDNTHARDALAAKFVNPATAQFTVVHWDGLGSLTGDVYFRKFLYLTAGPASFNTLLSHCWNAALLKGAGIGVGATGSPAPRKVMPTDADGVFLTALAGSVNIALNQFVRVEWRIRPSLTVGEIEWRLYNSPDSTTIDDTVASGSNLNTAANIDRVDFGFCSGSDEPSFSFWLDDIAVSTAGWIGPTASLQFSRPSADAAAGGWTPTPGSPTTLFDKLDESAVDDADFISATAL